MATHSAPLRPSVVIVIVTVFILLLIFSISRYSSETELKSASLTATKVRRFTEYRYTSSIGKDESCHFFSLLQISPNGLNKCKMITILSATFDNTFQFSFRKRHHFRRLFCMASDRTTIDYVNSIGKWWSPSANSRYESYFVPAEKFADRIFINFVKLG